MKDLSNINKIHKIRKTIWNRTRSFRYISVPLFLLRQTTENYEIPTRKNFEPTKYPREKIFDARNTHEKKFVTHKIPTRKNF